MSVCPSVVITFASESKELWTSNFANRLILAIGRLVLKMGYIGSQNLVPPILTKPVYWGFGHIERSISTKFDI